MITYGVKEPESRRKYLEAYGCVRWTPQAIEILAEFSRHWPIIEIGAGTGWLYFTSHIFDFHAAAISGHWERELRRAGTDIIAFDDFSTISPAEGNMVNNPIVGRVEEGNETTIQKHPKRTLLMCYPPDGDMAVRALKVYRGKWLVYIGEGRGGVNANSEFFDILEKDWIVEQVEELDPYPMCFERMYILRKRRT